MQDDDADAHDGTRPLALAAQEAGIVGLTGPGMKQNLNLRRGRR
jgi:hypothetical protein